MIDRIEKILEFWFGTFPNAWAGDESKRDMWFGNGAAYDAEIFSTFGADYFGAVDGDTPGIAPAVPGGDCRTAAGNRT